MTRTFGGAALTLAALLIPAFPGQGLATQERAAAATIRVQPEELTIEVGTEARLTATVHDGSGAELDAPVIFVSLARRSLGVTPDGRVEAYRAGDHAVMVIVPDDPDDDSRFPESSLRVRVPVHVPLPPVTAIEIVGAPDHFYVGTDVRLDTRILDSTGEIRQDIRPAFTSSAPDVATVDALGIVTALHPGEARISAAAGDAAAAVDVRVEPNRLAALELAWEERPVRTGDVVRFRAIARDAAGEAIADMPVHYAMRSRTVDHGLGEPGSGVIADDGRFVADLPGEYTIVAVAGERSASTTLRVDPRNAAREIEFLGQAPVRDRFTSDVWVFEGTDGRDYAITGTWAAAGHAYLWDVTNPRDMQLVDTVRVDARTVNDVKVSEDGRIAVISREGASDRRNGLVILDVSRPAEGMRVLARYDDQLTGGVHNVFIHDDHVYALSAGQRYDIINIEDPTRPHRVGRFELDTPGHSIHDVWVQDGIAFSSNWTDGVVAVDVGGGGRGGSPRQPVMLGSYAYPSGWNHAAYPYRSESTGKFYVFAGDEAGLDSVTAGYEGEPDLMDGYIHVIEWDDWERPREVARYRVPGAGSHNLWIEDDIMYIAYYQGGLRIVVVSGELMGDLFRQGREIGYFLPYDPAGHVANSPMVWGPQPYKGNIFFSDNHSGLWAIRIKEPETDED